MWERLYRFRHKLFDLIENVDDGYHKSYEGAMDVRFHYPNIFEDEPVEKVDFVEIEVHCYLLINGRHITFEGKTFDDALDKAEAWLERVTEEEGF